MNPPIGILPSEPSGDAVSLARWRKKQAYAQQLEQQAAEQRAAREREKAARLADAGGGMPSRETAGAAARVGEFQSKYSAVQEEQQRIMEQLRHKRDGAPPPPFGVTPAAPSSSSAPMDARERARQYARELDAAAPPLHSRIPPHPVDRDREPPQPRGGGPPRDLDYRAPREDDRFGRGVGDWDGPRSRRGSDGSGVESLDEWRRRDRLGDVPPAEPVARRNGMAPNYRELDRRERERQQQGPGYVDRAPPPPPPEFDSRDDRRYDGGSFARTLARPLPPAVPDSRYDRDEPPPARHRDFEHDRPYDRPPPDRLGERDRGAPWPDRDREREREPPPRSRDWEREPRSEQWDQAEKERAREEMRQRGWSPPRPKEAASAGAATPAYLPPHHQHSSSVLPSPTLAAGAPAPSSHAAASAAPSFARPSHSNWTSPSGVFLSPAVAAAQQSAEAAKKQRYADELKKQMEEKAARLREQKEEEERMKRKEEEMAARMKEEADREAAALLQKAAQARQHASAATSVAGDRSSVSPPAPSPASSAASHLRSPSPSSSRAGGGGGKSGLKSPLVLRPGETPTDQELEQLRKHRVKVDLAAAAAHAPTAAEGGDHTRLQREQAQQQESNEGASSYRGGEGGERRGPRSQREYDRDRDRGRGYSPPGGDREWARGRGGGGNERPRDDDRDPYHRDRPRRDDYDYADERHDRRDRPGSYRPQGPYDEEDGRARSERHYARSERGGAPPPRRYDRDSDRRDLYSRDGADEESVSEPWSQRGRGGRDRGYGHERDRDFERHANHSPHRSRSRSPPLPDPSAPAPIAPVLRALRVKSHLGSNLVAVSSGDPGDDVRRQIVAQELEADLGAQVRERRRRKSQVEEAEVRRAAEEDARVRKERQQLAERAQYERAVERGQHPPPPLSTFPAGAPSPTEDEFEGDFRAGGAGGRSASSSGRGYPPNRQAYEPSRYSSSPPRAGPGGGYEYGGAAARRDGARGNMHSAPSSYRHDEDPARGGAVYSSSARSGSGSGSASRAARGSAPLTESTVGLLHLAEDAQARIDATNAEMHARMRTTANTASAGGGRNQAQGQRQQQQYNVGGGGADYSSTPRSAYATAPVSPHRPDSSSSSFLRTPPLSPPTSTLSPSDRGIPQLPLAGGVGHGRGVRQSLNPMEQSLRGSSNFQPLSMGVGLSTSFAAPRGGGGGALGSLAEGAHEAEEAPLPDILEDELAGEAPLGSSPPSSGLAGDSSLAAGGIINQRSVFVYPDGRMTSSLRPRTAGAAPAFSSNRVYGVPPADSGSSIDLKPTNGAAKTPQQPNVTSSAPAASARTPVSSATAPEPIHVPVLASSVTPRASTARSFTSSTPSASADSTIGASQLQSQPQSQPQAQSYLSSSSRPSSASATAASPAPASTVAPASALSQSRPSTARGAGPSSYSSSFSNPVAASGSGSGSGSSGALSARSATAGPGTGAASGGVSGSFGAYRPYDHRAPTVQHPQPSSSSSYAASRAPMDMSLSASQSQRDSAAFPVGFASDLQQPSPSQPQQQQSQQFASPRSSASPSAPSGAASARAAVPSSSFAAASSSSLALRLPVRPESPGSMHVIHSPSASMYSPREVFLPPSPTRVGTMYAPMPMDGFPLAGSVNFDSDK